MNTFNKNLIYGLFAVCVLLLSFGFLSNTANAQFFYSTNTQNNTGDYAYYRQLCPADFSLTVYNANQYMCYKLFGVGQVLGASTSNYNYNGFSSYNSIPGCLPGYAYSELTGQRCDGSYYYGNTNVNGDYGDIENFDLRAGNDTDPQEGDNNAEIAKVRFDADNGDVRLDRVQFDFKFTGYGTGEDLPWNVFDEARLLLDGREIGRVNADHKSDWDKESNSRYSIVFSGLDDVIRENDRAELTLEMDINSTITGVSDGYVSWDISVPDDGLRARNGRGTVVYGGNDQDTAFISIQEN